MPNRTGIYDQSGKGANQKSNQGIGDKIDAIFDQAEDAFHSIAAEEGLQIARGMVPIDTHTLQRHIQAFRRGNATIIEVPDATLFYSQNPNQRSALAIALILEGGTGLRRTQSNVLPGTGKGQPTKDWFAIAGQRMQQEIQPIAANILQKAITEALNAINESI
jgi:hypothetical protein